MTYWRPVPPAGEGVRSPSPGFDFLGGVEEGAGGAEGGFQFNFGQEEGEGREEKFDFFK